MLNRPVKRQYWWRVVLNSGCPAVVSSLSLAIVDPLVFSSTWLFLIVLVLVGLALYVPAYVCCYVVLRAYSSSEDP